jgi:hypothetical protein
MIPLHKGVDYFSQPYHHKSLTEALAHAKLNLENIKRHKRNAYNAKTAREQFHSAELASDDRIHFYTIRKCALALPITTEQDRQTLEYIMEICDNGLMIKT